MPAFGDTLTNGEIAAVVAYVQWLGAPGDGVIAAASPAATPVAAP